MTASHRGDAIRSTWRSGGLNVLVVRPSRAGRRRGGRPVWFGFVGDTRVLGLVESWLRAGGPGLATIPDELELHVVAAPGLIG